MLACLFVCFKKSGNIVSFPSGGDGSKSFHRQTKKLLFNNSEIGSLPPCLSLSVCQIFSVRTPDLFVLWDALLFLI